MKSARVGTQYDSSSINLDLFFPIPDRPLSECLSSFILPSLHIISFERFPLIQLPFVGAFLVESAQDNNWFLSVFVYPYVLQEDIYVAYSVYNIKACNGNRIQYHTDSPHSIPGNNWYNLSLSLQVCIAIRIQISYGSLDGVASIIGEYTLLYNDSESVSEVILPLFGTLKVNKSLQGNSCLISRE